MQLVGGLANVRDFEGNESLADILALGTIVRAPFPMGDQLYIPEVKDWFSQETEKRRLGIRKALEAITREIPLPSQEGDLASTRDELVAEYLCSEIEAYFDRLSPELFEIEREMPMHVDKGYGQKDVKVTIPLFASARLDQEKWVCSAVNDSDGKYKYDVEITSFVPPITRDAKERLKAFRSVYMGAVSNALKEPLIGDFVMRDLEGNADLDLSVYWIPHPSDLKLTVDVVDKDPFIAARVYGRNFLVANWDVEGELPYEHYLKEFGMSRSIRHKVVPTKNPSNN